MECVSVSCSRPVSGAACRLGSAPADLTALFVRKEDIPREFRMEKPIEPDRVFLGGDLQPWKGRRLDVYSPIDVRTQEGFSPLRLGSLPRMTGRDALRALAAARKAFCGGRGAWPSLTLAGRIRRLEDFSARLAGTLTLKHLGPRQVNSTQVEWYDGYVLPTPSVLIPHWPK